MISLLHRDDPKLVKLILSWLHTCVQVSHMDSPPCLVCLPLEERLHPLASTPLPRPQTPLLHRSQGKGASQAGDSTHRWSALLDVLYRSQPCLLYYIYKCSTWYTQLVLTWKHLYFSLYGYLKLFIQGRCYFASSLLSCLICIYRQGFY